MLYKIFIPKIKIGAFFINLQELFTNIKVYYDDVIFLQPMSNFLYYFIIKMETVFFLVEKKADERIFFWGILLELSSYRWHSRPTQGHYSMWFLFTWNQYSLIFSLMFTLQRNYFLILSLICKFHQIKFWIIFFSWLNKFKKRVDKK